MLCYLVLILLSIHTVSGQLRLNESHSNLDGDGDGIPDPDDPNEIRMKAIPSDSVKESVVPIDISQLLPPDTPIEVAPNPIETSMNEMPGPREDVIGRVYEPPDSNSGGGELVEEVIEEELGILTIEPRQVAETTVTPAAVFQPGGGPTVKPDETKADEKAEGKANNTLWIVLGVLAALAAIILIVCCVVHCKRKKRTVADAGPICPDQPPA